MAELTNDHQREHYEVIVFPPEGDVLKKFDTEEKARAYAARSSVVQWNPMLQHVVTMVATELLPLVQSPGDPKGGESDG